MQANQEMYDRFGVAYHAKRGREQDSAWNRYLDQPMIEALLAGITPCKVADLGCGSGLLSRWLKDRGFDVTGADFSQSLVDIARGENPDIGFCVADIKSTPYPADSFALIVSALVVHYEQDLAPVFAEIARILQPGGQLVFSMHHPLDEVTSMGTRIDDGRKVRPYFHNDPYQFQMAGMDLTAYHHTFENIAQALFANGFVIEDLREARMIEAAKEKFPEYYERTNQYPSFVGFRASLRLDR
ncbi:class I SAM-dependent DNA methyltransferase [Cerasicoccus fimbriatus]|uniref:class I SAM-dependent DNA methyltransferase n=1 Tax=Cerasicoccus fimbriatus TaxID=3014554 RepID=UPI0022B5AD26|nr:class I SAM-dependent methyltransferase [Cerasicoccus sp. TK19100]